MIEFLFLKNQLESWEGIKTFVENLSINAFPNDGNYS